MTANNYAQKKLSKELREIETIDLQTKQLGLSIYEKAIIYKYSTDAFEDLNEELRKTRGDKITTFGKLLDKCLAKLPNFEDIVYRGVNLTTKELNRYIDAYNDNLNLAEYQFLSSSTSKAEAHQYGETLFRIFSKTGKSIEALSKYPSEKEVVFRCNTVFEVLLIDFNEDTGKYSITMEEM